MTNRLPILALALLVTFSDFGPSRPAAGRSLTLAGDSLDADAELYSGTKDQYLDDPTTADVGKPQITFPVAVTITRIWCSTDTGTATIQFDERAEATPNTAAYAEAAGAR